MAQNPFDGEKRLIDLSARFVVRGLEDGLSPRVDRCPDGFQYEHARIGLKPLFRSVFLQQLINRRKLFEKFLHTEYHSIAFNEFQQDIFLFWLNKQTLCLDFTLDLY
jgi:hypothetical protein